LTCSQPSLALAAWSASVPGRAIHDQPSPILCQVTGAPSPVCWCTRASASSADSSPVFHLALLTNWYTTIGQPWFQARSASPNAAVDLPFISPVCTTISARLRRCLVVSPSSGTARGLPWGIRPPP